MSALDSNKPTADVAATSASVEPEGKEGRSSLVELKNGKVYFKQKCISFEKQSETLQEIVQFREMLEERIEGKAPPLLAIPDEYHPLIAKLAHESDKTLAALSKHILQELLPSQDDDEGRASAAQALPLSAVETAIKTIVQHNNYGLDGIGGGKARAAVSVWRWEVREQHRDWLPKNAREKAERRIAERVQAKQDLLSIFEALPQEERDAILDPKGTNKLPQKEMNVADSSKPSESISGEKTPPQSAKKKQKRKVEEENDAASKQSGTKTARAPKPVDPAKAVKEQEKLEKKAAKAEKEKKEKDAQNKSRSLMANFFAKPKNTPTRETPLKDADSSVAGPSNTRSEFEKSFKPFVLKKDTELAPINWFLETKNRKKRPSPGRLDDDIIVIDDDDEMRDRDVEMGNAGSAIIDVAALNTSDHLRSIISSLPPPADLSRRPLPHTQIQGLKTYNAPCVRDIVAKLSEAEVAGDTSVVRSQLSQLNDRTLLPAKVFIFHEDARPGYFGTWTRNSRIIGPRTPFAKDVLVFDYGYDSGEEWEEEPAGDADDVAEDAEDEEDGDDPDSDLDSWLVDDDEEPGLSLEDMDQLPTEIPDLPVLSTKRKAEEGDKKLGKKRKVVIPLVPFARGPCWETSIGHCDSSVFDPYKITVFNDTPFPIDPFTFVSTCVQDSKREHAKPPLPNKPVLLDDGVFVVPSLPERLNPSNTSTPGALVAPTSAPTITPGATLKKPTLAPKTPFPDAHLPVLLEKIISLQTGSMSFLVEAIHRDLREHNVKKNMIEAKVREVGEKCKVKKCWIVKPAVQVDNSS